MKAILKIICWVYGHRINSYLIELTPKKKCLRCGKQIYDWSSNHYQANKEAIEFERKKLGNHPKTSRR